VEVAGSCAPGFEAVRDAFVENFRRGEELGASVAVTRDGELLVDLWAGAADPQGTPWREDTLVNVYSTTKTMAALCVLMLADRGQLDLAAPVAEYWPEFAQRGKRDVRVSHVMSHSAGLAGFDPPLPDVEALYDWDDVVDHLARQAPWWEPGSAPGYHAVTQGYLQGEIVRRVTGRSLGTFFREEVAGPLGADFHIGLDARHDPRVGELVPPDVALGSRLADSDGIATRALRSVALDATEPRSRAWRRAEIPAAGGFGNARSVARVHAALACGGGVGGVRLLSEAGALRALDEQIRGTDLVLQMPVVYGMGYGLNDAALPIGPHPRTCYWGGWGGSLAIIDFDARATVTYVMNRMAANLLGDLRGMRVAAAALGALAAPA
jgi:CubicO group peptidase (beta-lactamase class C family)